MQYPIAIHVEPGTCYGVIVPDVPGCHSAGDTLEDAIASAREAISGHLETLLELGDPLPQPPQPIEVHMANPDYAGAVWAVVEVDLVELDPTPERVNISVPRFALAAIDRFAKAHQKTRSGFLVESALQAMAVK